MRYILLLLFLSTSAIAQQLSFQVLSAADSSAVPYAHLLLRQTKSGTYSDANGYVKHTALQQDSAIVSAVGYKKRVFSLDQIPSEVYLEEDIYELPVLAVNAEKLKLKTVQRHYNRKKCKFGIASNGMLMRRFKNPSKKLTYLDNIKFFLFHGDKTPPHEEVTIYAYRIVVYATDKKNNLRGVLYLDEQPRFIDTQEKVLTIDFGDVIVSKGFFMVGIQMLGPVRDDEIIPMSTEMKDGRKSISVGMYSSNQGADTFYQNLEDEELREFYSSTTTRRGMGLGSYDNISLNLNIGIQMSYVK
jgi:hypothetical protein